MSRIRLLLRDSSIYLLGNLLQKASAFLLLPLYTNALTTGQYGLLELANTVVNLMLLVVALGVPYSINKCYHRDCPDEPSRMRLAGTALTFTTAMTIPLVLAGWALEKPLSGLIFSGPEGLLVYRFTLAWLLLAQIATVSLEWVRAAGRASLFVGLSVTQLAVQMVASFVLVRWGGFGLSGVLMGNVAGLIAVNLLGGVLILRMSILTIDRRLLWAMCSYGLAMIPVFLSGWVVNVSDRFFVQSMVGLGALGIYALGYKFGALVDLLLVVPFQRAWTPLFFSIAGEADAPQYLARVTTYLMGGLGLASLAVSLAVPPLLTVVSAPEFRGASQIVPIICVAYMLGGLANCLGNGLIVAGRVRLIAAYAIAAALVNLALNLFLIPLLGVYGAAIATVIAFALQLVGILISLARHYPTRLETGRLLGLATACGAPFLASLALPPLPFVLDVLARLVLIAAGPGLIVALRLIRPEEMEAARKFLSNLRRAGVPAHPAAGDAPGQEG